MPTIHVYYRIIPNSTIVEAVKVLINAFVGKENVDHACSQVVFSHKEEQNHIIFRKIDDPGEHHFNRNKPEP